MFEKNWLFSENTSPHSTHGIIPHFVPPGSRVLDVGCNTGVMGAILKRHKCISDGIDINEEALKEAKKHYRHLFKRDLQSGKFDIQNERYDVIIFADVLEHLTRPDQLLDDCKKYLNKDGIIIISLPNVARFEVRLHLLSGKFEYTETGSLDRDHLRFFTLKTGRELIENSGFTIIHTVPTGLGHKLKLLPTLTAYQFIFVARKNDEPIGT